MMGASLDPFLVSTIVHMGMVSRILSRLPHRRARHHRGLWYGRVLRVDTTMTPNTLEGAASYSSPWSTTMSGAKPVGVVISFMVVCQATYSGRFIYMPYNMVAHLLISNSSVLETKKYESSSPLAFQVQPVESPSIFDTVQPNR